MTLGMPRTFSCVSEAADLRRVVCTDGIGEVGMEKAAALWVEIWEFPEAQLLPGRLKWPSDWLWDARECQV